MSQSIQTNQNFFNDSYGQVELLPSHMIGENEIEHQLFNSEDPIVQANSTNNQTEKREHTAPKVLFTVIHKILKSQLDTTSKFQDLLRDVKMKHTNSTLLKYIILAKKAQLVPILKNTFPSKAEERLQQLKSKNSWTEKRFKCANSFKMKIEKALSCRDSKKIIEIVWQGSRHQSKLNQSIEVANTFQKMMRRYKRSHLRKSA